MGVHSCGLYTEATDSDAGAATVNETDANETGNCEVCLQRSANLTSRWCHAAISDFAKRVFVTWSVLEVVVLSAVRTSTWLYACFDILR